jgi:hypothetical protein
MTKPQQSSDEQSIAMEKVRAAMQSHRDHLLSLPNVVGLGIGMRQKKGEWTNTISLIVMVKQKLPLKALAVEHRIPPEIDGIPVDVQETGSFFSSG